MVGDETLSSAAIAKCEDLARAVDACLAAAALHARLANPTPIPDGGGGLAAALNAVALKCAEEAKATRFRPGLDARDYHAGSTSWPSRATTLASAMGRCPLVSEGFLESADGAVELGEARGLS